MCRTAALELFTQDRNDFGSQDLNLLQRDLQRQAGVIDEEKLALVVTNGICIAQVTFDDLLRRADGQWSDVLEFFQRWPMSIDRGIVEVGAENFLGFLFRLSGEDLPTKSDNCLISSTMTVVLKALAVEIDHGCGVLDIPENVVMEETVPIKGGLLSNLGGPD